MARKSIQEMAKELYQDEQLAAAVVADAESKGTTKQIERGVLTLPHPIDARSWLRAKMAKDNPPVEEDE